MVTVRKMTKQDVPGLYEMALRAFQPDFERYGVFPPLLNEKRKRFRPPLPFGKALYADNRMVGGAFVAGKDRDNAAYRTRGHEEGPALRPEVLFGLDDNRAKHANDGIPPLCHRIPGTTPSCRRAARTNLPCAGLLF